MNDNLLARYKQKHYRLVAYVREMGLPLPGQQFRFVTRRTFNAVQFLEFIAESERIIDLKIAIYSINFEAAQILLGLVQCGIVARADILMSNLRNKAHREKEEIVKQMFIDHPKISLFFCSSHAKIFSCATEKGNYYTVEGSGNLAFNSRIEQYVIDNDRELYEFTGRWMAEIKQFLIDQKKKELEVC